jgi:hypothetical protein
MGSVVEQAGGLLGMWLMQPARRRFPDASHIGRVDHWVGSVSPYPFAVPDAQSRPCRDDEQYPNRDHEIRHLCVSPTEDEQQLSASVTRIGAGYLESLGSRLPNSTPATREPPITTNPMMSTTASAARPHHISIISRRLNHSWFGWCDRSRDGHHHRVGRRDESRSAAPDLHAISTFPSCNGRSDGGC